MEHLIIGLYIVAFVMGVISIYHLNAAYHFQRHVFLKTYKLHIFVFNLIVFSLAVKNYYVVNIVNAIADTGNGGKQYFAGLLLLFRRAVEYFGMIILAYTLVRMLHQMQKIRQEKYIRTGFVSLLILSAFAYGIGVANFFNGNPGWLDLFCDWISGVFFVVIGVFFIALFKMRKNEKDVLNYSPRSFLLFYIIILSIFLIQSIFHFKHQNISIAVLLLAINYFPMIWWKSDKPLATSNGFSLNISTAHVDRIVTEHHISNREREILEYILHGYSNREIKNKLFLSHHTVKNHNYNLFKKLGVRNRGELIRKTLEYESHQ